ncbi:hypothetical protein A2533_01055 [Candidatus Falkowbacteria bacterium RIFOXYD2_FULL_35_9]|uniref:Glycerophosphoryl diester phosphodiesterase membrane domain-containing protein n=1 Tax=Candidatus Falkowbacteria bacterium RIFOXYC2_FULL_36_12 TaxID=1798002 RepID=A0A1F5T2Z1_9BACT|nr:MAG: hypothetical protein A2478_01390 [Candidatus Falkowbacteria bacterium RIFOXYC2_FULL_36_12]OGF34221.1 MAG: hypothetical protein A2223_03705 [Candidatus Falkowbacteria bacterium RIFOXYA2_FULL_35_8]OGF47905.1 MAG: hypothetical protein A2533_01055 [Candidatus Falkowbacteria bacterium RIFOXYD2_FULL_35_9]
MEKFYRQILFRSWRVTWRFRWLWLFGFFATFLGNASFYEAIIRSFNDMSEGRSIYYTLRQYANTGIFSTFSWTKLIDLWQTDTVSFSLSLFTILFVMLVASLIIILAIVSQISLIKSAITLDQNKKISFKQAFSLGIHKFWPVLGLNIITRVVMTGFVIFIAFLVSLYIAQTSWIAYALYIVSFLVLLLLGIIIYFLTIYASAFIVLRDKGIFVSIRYAWYIFKQNMLLNIEMGFILFLLNILIGLLAIVFAVFVLSPFILLYLMMVLMSLSGGLGLLVVLIVILALAIIAVFGSGYTTFQVTVWSILFEELALKRGKSKMRRIVDQIKHRVKKKK